MASLPLMRFSLSPRSSSPPGDSGTIPAGQHLLPQIPGEPEFAVLAVAPLTRWPEVRQQVKAEIMERIQYADPTAQDDRLEIAGSRLRSRPLRPFRRWGWVAAWLVLLVAFGFAYVDTWLNSQSARYSRSPQPSLAGRAIQKRQASVITGTPFVDPEEVYFSRLEQIEERLKKSPADPLLFYAWVHLKRVNADRVPAGFDDRWRQIEPDNAYWPALNAAMSGKRLLDRYDLTHIWSPDPQVLAAFTQSLEEAARLPHWIDRQEEIRIIQSAAFRPPATLEEDRFTANSIARMAFPPLSGLSSVLKYQMTRLLNDRNPAAASSLIDTWCQVETLRISQPGASIPSASYAAGGGAAVLEKIARSYGLTAGADKLAKVRELAIVWYRGTTAPPPAPSSTGATPVSENRHLPSRLND